MSISLPGKLLVMALLLSPMASFAQSGGGGGGGGGSSGGGSAGGGSIKRRLAGGASGGSVGTSPGTTAPSAGSAGAGTSAISGAPNGPANPAGLNNSLNDPSGAANASSLGMYRARMRQGPQTRAAPLGMRAGETLHLAAPSQLGQQVTEPVAQALAALTVR